MRTALLLPALAACAKLVQFDPVQVPGDDVDAGVDASPACFGTALEVCVDPSEPLELAGELDTGSISCLDTVSAACVIAATDITIPTGATLQVTGARPLVLIATGRLAIAGTLDASSHAGKAGPGAATATCNAFAITPSPRGGGAGGSFGGLGGAGAGGESPTTGNGGEPGTAVELELGAGCPGQNSGSPTSPFGIGGLGGGAVYLIAGDAIEIAGTLSAAGAPGTGGECTGDCASSNGTAHGGGGGGSGGMVLLEAPMVAVGGSVFADGGGGGEGSSITRNGADGGSPDGTAAAPGGGLDAASPTNGGNGGAGSHATTPAATAEPGDDPGAGGGGGGGAGVIRLYGARSITGDGIVSPALVTRARTSDVSLAPEQAAR